MTRSKNTERCRSWIRNLLLPTSFGVIRFNNRGNRKKPSRYYAKLRKSIRPFTEIVDASKTTACRAQISQLLPPKPYGLPRVYRDVRRAEKMIPSAYES